MKIGLVEDDAKIRKWLRVFLDEAGYEVIEASGSEEFKEMVLLKPDLWLLDVDLGDQSIFDWLPDNMISPIVFVTGSREHAMRAFDLGAVDYVTKPIKKERLLLSIERAKKQLEGEPRASKKEQYKQFLKVSERGERLWIPVQQVDWIEGADYCSQIHVGPKTWVVQESLRSLEQALDPQLFLRVHRSAIIQVSQIQRVTDESFGGMKVTLYSGQEISVSRRRKKQVKDLLNN